MIETENNVCTNDNCGLVVVDESGFKLSWQPCCECNNKKSVKKFIGTDKAFVLLFNDNSLILWGDLTNIHSDSEDDDGESDTSQEEQVTEPEFDPLNGDVYVTEKAFAQIDDQGNVTTWGHENFGGDSTAVQEQLQHITHIASTDWAFAALTESMDVVTWGYKDFGGDSQKVQDQLTDVITISATGHSFAAIKNNGQVVTWGDFIYTKEHIGEDVPDTDTDTDTDSDENEEEVSELEPEALLEELNSSGGFGGNCDEVSDWLQEGVIQVVSTNMAFAAHQINIILVNDNLNDNLNDNESIVVEKIVDESIVIWGHHYSGGSFKLAQYVEMEDIDSVIYENKCLIILDIEGAEVTVPVST